MTQAQKAAYLRWLQDPAVVEFQRKAGESTVEDLGYFTESNQKAPGN
jgi:hypothetical protein